MYRSKPNWLDLPQGIFEIIVNKLHYADQVRVLAVCKTWQDCKDYVRCLDTRSWGMCYERRPRVKSDKRSFLGELFDPYSRNVHKLTNSLDINPYLSYVPLASKHGWACGLFRGTGSSFVFLHNPFRNEIRFVARIAFGFKDDILCTIKGNPASTECEIFTLVLSAANLRMYSKKPGGFSAKFITKTYEDEVLYSVLYMNDNIYCLFWNGALNRYNLRDKSWELLTSGFPTPYKKCGEMEDCWLMEINENLMMVCLAYAGDWVIFRFDCSKMSWVIETGLKNCAIYISGHVAFSTPLSNRPGEIVESCKLFYLDEDSREFECYSMNKAPGSEIQSEEYNWISINKECEFSFIEPPYSGI